ncbi:MAG: transcriptional regulator [Candidatus Accumulibacter sp. UW26]|jgi:hypothetical protein
MNAQRKPIATSIKAISPRTARQQSGGIADALRNFDALPDSAAVSLTDASSILAGRSKASLYRDFKAGRLALIKIGRSTAVRVGDLRKLLGA